MSNRSPISVVVVDDEPLARDRLRRLIEDEGDMSLVAECANGDDAVETVVRLRPDLLFLDVQMPGRDGFEVVAELVDGLPPDSVPAIVFVTAYDAHALRAFDAKALDYLVKPFEDDRFAETLERARLQINQGRLGALTAQLRDLLAVGTGSALPAASESARLLTEGAMPEAATGRLDRIVLRTRNRARIIRAEDVDWIGADGVYARLHFDGSTALIRTPMHELETRLDAMRFVRIHRSTIVNLDRVRELREVDRGEYDVVLVDGTRLKLSRSRRAQLEAMLGQRL